MRIIAFSSPKGGSGRTMLAANIAANFAVGCEWAGLTPKIVLAIDADVKSPGLHYYDFVKWFSAGGKMWAYKIKGQKYYKLSQLLGVIKANPHQGLLYWMHAVMSSSAFQEFRKKLPKPRNENEIKTQHSIICNATLELLATYKDDPANLMNPWSHIIEIVDENDNLRMMILPAGDPEQYLYHEVLDFGWKSFFEANGSAIFHALYSTLSAGATITTKFKAPREIPGVERIILDQEAGLSLPGVSHRLFANHQVIVCGLNGQNQDGLFGLLNYGKKAEIRVVLSQYQRRYIAAREYVESRYSSANVNSYYPKQDFNYEEEIRQKLLKRLEDEAIKKENVFLADFIPRAVNHEYFAQPDSDYHNEMVRLMVSMETEGSEHKIEIAAKEVRILGEFVGISGGDVPSGPIGAFREWAEKHGLTAGHSVSGIATGHKEIAELISKGSVRLTTRGVEGSNRQLNKKNIFQKNKLLHLYKAEEGNGIKFELADFDIVALPQYLILHAQPLLEFLSGPKLNIKSADRLTPIDNDYLKTSIRGWDIYAHIPNGEERRLIGYPLFVDSQLIAYNEDHINDRQFGEEYFHLHFRHFFGFYDPADVLSVARAASANTLPHDRLIMTLEPGHIAKWYEWQMILGLFGATDFHTTKSPWEDLWSAGTNRLLDEKTIRATAIYLELCEYAEESSDSADWDKAILHFFRDRSVGMAFIWPDAIPRAFRTVTKEPNFRYAVPPGDFHYEECWLLTIPIKRGVARATRDELESLLQSFLTYNNQLLYHKLGGLSTHERVLRSPELWAEDPSLPVLCQVKHRSEAILRIASKDALKFACEIVKALEDIRLKIPLSTKKTVRNPSIRVPKTERNDRQGYNWKDDEAIQKIITDRFREIQTNIKK